MDKIQAKTNDDIDARVALLEYQFTEVLKKLDRIDNKQDLLRGALDTLRYVETKDFTAYQKDAENKFASKIELRNNAKLLYWLLGLTGSMFLILAAAFVGLVIKK